jgi:hypothetical protein
MVVATPLPEDELVALALRCALKTARYLLWLRWRARLGRLGGARDGAERWPVHG